MTRGFLSLLSVCILLASCSQKKPAPVPDTAVNLYTVKAQKVRYFDKYPATTVALNQVDLRPQVQGYITSISFTEGDHIRKGQVLYEIDRQLFQEGYDQAKANVDVAKGNLAQAQQDADRYAYLNANDAVAKQVYDHALIALQNAKNTLAASDQALKMASTNLNFSIISAPFDGTIGFSQVKLGNMVTAGQTVLNTISTDDPMGVDILISEKQLARFENLKKRGETMDSLFTMTLPNDSIYPFNGKISVIDRAVDPQTGTIRVRLVFPNAGYRLKPGTSCVLRVLNLEKEPKLLVPARAIVELMGEYFVYLAKDTLARDPDDSTKTHHAWMALQKKVTLGQSIAPNVILKKGVNEGDQIILDGVQSVHTGSLIDISKTADVTKGKKKQTNE